LPRSVRSRGCRGRAYFGRRGSPRCHHFVGGQPEFNEILLLIDTAPDEEIERLLALMRPFGRLSPEEFASWVRDRRARRGIAARPMIG
jgi:hypothetical protein